MAAIRSKNTKPEMIVRRWLWSRGFRYRLNSPRLPGHPDLVLRKYRTCIFVNGCFWHGHHVDLHFVDLQSDDLRQDDQQLDAVKNVNALQLAIEDSACCKIPHTNRAFWVRKIRRNQLRDVRDQKRLAEMGWHCITVWECELRPKVREQTLLSLEYTLNRIFLQDRSLHKVLPPHPNGYTYPPVEEEPGIGMAAEPFV